MENFRTQTQTQNNTTKKTDQSSSVKCRIRKPTLLKLQWLAERVRKCERIKRDLASGSYKVDSDAIARAILNID